MDQQGSSVRPPPASTNGASCELIPGTMTGEAIAERRRARRNAQQDDGCGPRRRVAIALSAKAPILPYSFVAVACPLRVIGVTSSRQRCEAGRDGAALRLRRVRYSR